MTDCSNLLDIITAVCGILTAGGGLCAASSALQSAKTARTAMKLAAQTESRALRRQLTYASGDILSESQRVKEFAQLLRLEHRMLLISSGMSSSTSETLAVEQINSRISLVEQYTNEAQQLVYQFNGLATASDEDIARTLSRVEYHLLQVRTQRIALEQEKTEITNAKNEILRTQNKSA